MTVVLGATLLVLRIVGGVLAVLLAAVAVVLFLPVGLDIRWSKKEGAHCRQGSARCPCRFIHSPKKCRQIRSDLPVPKRPGKSPNAKARMRQDLMHRRAKRFLLQRKGRPLLLHPLHLKSRNRGRTRPGRSQERRRPPCPEQTRWTGC